MPETPVYERIRYEEAAPGVGRITLARSEKANAQDRKMLYEIDHAFLRAMQEDETKVVILAAYGVNGHEYFTHTWELGARKAKEMLFRGHALTAEECHRLGMVNHVVPREQLPAFTLQIAEEIAARPAMGLKLAKLAVNQSLDAQGQYNAIQSAIGLHHLGHAHARVVHGIPVDPSGMQVIRDLSKKA